MPAPFLDAAADPAAPLAVTTARVVGGGLWSLGWQSATLLASLIATPFVIRLLGPAEYGVLALVNVLVGYAAVSEFGMTQAATKFGAEAHARGDDRGEAAVVWTALLILLVPTAIAVGVLVAMSGWLADSVLHVPPALRSTTVWALRLAAVTLGIRAVSGVLTEPHVVRLRLDLASGVTNAGALVQIAAIPVLLWALHIGLAGAVGVIAAAAGVVAVLHGAVACRFLPRLRTPALARGLIAPMMGYGASTGAMVLVALVLMHAEKFFVAGYGSASALGFYAVAFTLARLLVVLPGALAQVLLPAFSRLQMDENRAPMEALWTRSLRALVLVNLPLAALLAFSSAPLLQLWAGPEYAAMSRVPLVVLTIGCFIDGLSFVPRMLLQATGRPDLMAKYLACTVLPYLAAAAWLIERWGIVGAAVAWTARTAVECTLMMFGARRTARVAYGALVPPNFGVAMLSLLIPALAAPWTRHSPVATVAIGAASVIVYAWIVWARVLSGEERAWVAAFCAPVIGRGSVAA